MDESKSGEKSMHRTSGTHEFLFQTSYMMFLAVERSIRSFWIINATSPTQEKPHHLFRRWSVIPHQSLISFLTKTKFAGK
jgi:hypothetical protein